MFHGRGGGAKGMGGKRHGGQKTRGQKAGGQKAWGAKGRGAKDWGAKDRGAKDRGAKDRGAKVLEPFGCGYTQSNLSAPHPEGLRGPGTEVALFQAMKYCLASEGQRFFNVFYSHDQYINNLLCI